VLIIEVQEEAGVVVLGNMGFGIGLMGLLDKVHGLK